jgi:microfibrillar-associated protein 1
MSDARLQRLNALVSSKKEKSTPASTRRERIRAEVIYSTAPKSDVVKTNEEQLLLRQQMKELALQRQKEEEEQKALEAISAKEKGEPFEDEKEEEDESEDERPLPLLKPVFVKMDARQKVTAPVVEGVEREILRKEREREAHELLIQHVRKEYEASTQAKEDTSTAVSFKPEMVDDTDDIDPEEEIAAWKLRDLLRIKRDREEGDRWEREKMELERIRNMTEDERRALDEEKMKEWMAQPAGQMRFMQKYYHKGAFYMDNEDALFKRDYAQATGEDAHANREILPEVKQVRDFGKKGRTKWTHLVAEDTTAFDYGWGQRKHEANYKLIPKMGGMKGQQQQQQQQQQPDNPSKRPKT